MALKAVEGGDNSTSKPLQTTKITKSTESVKRPQRTTVIGTKDYVDAETGVVETFNVITTSEKDFNFQKLWLGHILEAIQEIGNAKMQVLMYLINNREKANNMIVKTTQEIAELTGISKKTVIETLKILEQHKIIKRKTGVVVLNPDVIFKGSPQKRMSILLQYHSLNDEDEKLTPAQMRELKCKEQKNQEQILKRKAELLKELEELQEYEDNE